MKPLPIRVRLTGWYLAVICFTFVLSSLGMYLGMRSAIQHTVDRALAERVEEMRQFLWRHRLIAKSEMPEHFRRSSEIQPGEELFQVADSSGAWLYQAPMMDALHVPGTLPIRTARLSTQPFLGDISMSGSCLRRSRCPGNIT